MKHLGAVRTASITTVLCGQSYATCNQVISKQRFSDCLWQQKIQGEVQSQPASTRVSSSMLHLFLELHGHQHLPQLVTIQLIREQPVTPRRKASKQRSECMGRPACLPADVPWSCRIEADTLILIQGFE
jgi:hypothetical protein